jgi:predicted GIY-YIG superfamily endonuclease
MSILNNYLVYLLVNNDNNCTYIGCTNNSVRRLRQHNCELVGGAKYTKMKKGNGNWTYYGQIINLDKHLALSIEKKIQKRTRKTKGKTPLEKRLNCISKLLEEYLEINFTILPNLLNLPSLL